ncbi:MAG: hypothetical protein LBT06_17180 [Hungatella sp.]|jgi:hypothetical protein|nr:hypothetical protein [Hungatella sp.]
MNHLDEELLEAKREMERQKHTTLGTGIYVGEELITFSLTVLPDSSVRIPLPEQFIVMPEKIREIKYPSGKAPTYIVTSLDSTVNICVNLLPVILQEGELHIMSLQFQTALKNFNPSIVIKGQSDGQTEQGNEMEWFEYKGYQLDGQSYNRVYLIKMRKYVMHGVFSCMPEDENNWENIVEKIFAAVEEEL